MRILMFGWEFPPHISGGLGTACYGMTRALAKRGTEILFVLPRLKASPPAGAPAAATSTDNTHLTLVPASGVRADRSTSSRLEWTVRNLWEERLKICPVESLLFPYDTPEGYAEHLLWVQQKKQHDAHFHEDQSSSSSNTFDFKGDYGNNLMAEVLRFSQAGGLIALQNEFDIIHAHDWMTYPAGMLAKQLTGKPLVAHLHSMEYDRSGSNINHEVAAIERAGLMMADKVVAVSHYTRNLAIREYGIPPEKIVVVYNAVSRHEVESVYNVPPRMSREKRVLFMGRVTYQKGPEYFIEAAHRVLQHIPNVRFIMAGSGDMLRRMVERTAELRIGNRVHFTGFLKGGEVDRMYAMSDLYVMPSVSEPFGITPLEAMLYDIPVLLSKQSGVSEILHNALKVDFWDVQEMANKICAVLSYPSLATELVKNCREELKNIRWENAAGHLNELYYQMRA